MIFVRFFCSKPIIAFNGGVDSNVYIQGEKKGPKSSANQHSKKKKRWPKCYLYIIFVLYRLYTL